MSCVIYRQQKLGYDGHGIDVGIDSAQCGGGDTICNDILSIDKLFVLQPDGAQHTLFIFHILFACDRMNETKLICVNIVVSGFSFHDNQFNIGKDDVVVMELDDCQMSDNYKIREKWEEKMIRQFLVASDCFI